MDWELTTKHLLSGFMPIFAVLIIYFIILHISGKRQKLGHIILSFIFSFYLLGILTVTGVWFVSAFSPRIVYVPFVDMIRGPVDTVANVLLFIPLGVLLPILYKRFNKFGKVALAGFLISLSIECVQMFGTGATDINDLITNTAGACLGFFIYMLICKVMPKSWIKKVQVDGIQCYFELLIFWVCSLLIMITVQPILYHALFAPQTVGGDMHAWE